MTEPAQAESPLNLRLILASFGLGVSIAGAVVFFVLGLVPVAVVFLVLALVTVVDLVVILRRRRLRRLIDSAYGSPSHGPFE